MQYRKDKYGNEISILGYGCMRFTQKAGIIDLAKAEKEVLFAVSKGINYFDTAYLYQGNEAALGTVLERTGLRDRIYLATKLPHYLVKKTADFERIFQEELRRLKTDHIDYYLIHMINDVKSFERLEALGIREWLAEKKKSGQIRQLGFSYHGSADKFTELLDVYDWDFCQVQYNYIDVNSQAGVTGVRAAYEKGLPVIIMEPLRGGKLAEHLPAGAKEAFEKAPVKRSPAEWAFRWLWDQKEITCVLSGMNSLSMIEENAKAASEAEAGCISEEERKIYEAASEAIQKTMRIPCTGCRYCMPCPAGVDIPGAFASYNSVPTDGWFKGFTDYFRCVVLRKDYTGVSNCIGCGKCESHCPQHIEIRKELKTVKKDFEGPVFRVARKAAGWIMKY